MDTSSRTKIIILGVVLIGLAVFLDACDGGNRYTHKTSTLALGPRLLAENLHLEWPAEQGGTMSMDIIVCLGNTSTEPCSHTGSSASVTPIAEKITVWKILYLDGKGTTADQVYEYELKHTVGSEEININGSSYSTRNGLVFVVTDNAIHQINRKDLHFSEIKTYTPPELSANIKDVLLAEVRKAIEKQ
jgi:hypothetical protein